MSSVNRQAARLRNWTRLMGLCGWCGSIFPAHRCHGAWMPVEQVVDSINRTNGSGAGGDWRFPW